MISLEELLIVHPYVYILLKGFQGCLPVLDVE